MKRLLVAFKENWKDIAFWTSAVFLLFFFLGVHGIAKTEALWGCVVREMFASGDFWNPTVNYDSYFDKPLLSYWLIAICALFNGRDTNELIIRIPSALAALSVLWSVRFLARKMWNSELVAQTSSWIMLGIYSFAFWGRLGEADMLNLAFATWAVVLYVWCNRTPGFWVYLGFGILCALGGHTKGMSAIAIPVITVLCDLVLRKEIKPHLNFKLFLAMIISLAIYLLLFLLPAVFSHEVGNSDGLALAFRENIVRFFHAFDHTGPWYIYFIHLPRLFIPWSLLLILALIWAFKSYKQLDPYEKWMLVCIVAIFLVFSISESKRAYYILPILPYCALLTGRFISATSSAEDARLRKIAVIHNKILLYVLRIASALVAIVAVAWLIWATAISKGDHDTQRLLTIVVVVMIVFLTVAGNLLSLGLRNLISSSHPYLVMFEKSAILVVFMMFIIFAVASPSFNRIYGAERSFHETTKTLVGPENQDNLVFWGYTYNDAVFYLHYNKQIPVFHFSHEAELYKFINTRDEVYIITKWKYLEKFSDRNFVTYLKEHIVLKEPYLKLKKKSPWEKRFVLIKITSNKQEQGL